MDINIEKSMEEAILETAERLFLENGYAFNFDNSNSERGRMQSGFSTLLFSDERKFI